MIKINKIQAQWLSTVAQGKRLEMLAVGDDGEELTNMSYPLATIVADDKNESLFVELYTEDGTVQIPLYELKRVFEMAQDTVHSESWYEKNIYKSNGIT